MTTRIAACTSDGRAGRCDTRCCDAHEPDCERICGARNHGAGQQQATGRTRELAGSWIDHARANGQDITRAELATAAAHAPLFDLSEWERQP